MWICESRVVPLTLRLRLLLPVLVVAMFVTLGPARPATAACECTKLTVPEALTEATVAFVGELQSVQPVDTLTVMSFRVDGVYKGEVPTAFNVATFSNPDECGLGTSPTLGQWIVFAVQFPPTDGAFYASACSPSGLLEPGVPLPVELGTARPPSDAVQPATTSPPTTASPVVGAADTNDWVRPVAIAALAMAALGVISRILAGRRRLVV